MPLEQPGVMDLLKQFTGIGSGPTTATDKQAQTLGLDPSSPDILKSIAAMVSKVKEGGNMPDEETAKTMGAAMKAHLDYNASLSLLQSLNKAYSAKYGQGTKQ